MTEALRLITADAFTEFGLHRLEANARSLALLADDP